MKRVVALNEAGRVSANVGELDKAEELGLQRAELARSNGAPELFGCGHQ